MRLDQLAFIKGILALGTLNKDARRIYDAFFVVTDVSLDFRLVAFEPGHIYKRSFCFLFFLLSSFLLSWTDSRPRNTRKRKPKRM